MQPTVRTLSFVLPAEIDIPNVVGLTPAEAQAALINAGFNVVYNQGATNARIISQTPSGKAVRGTTVVITAN